MFDPITQGLAAASSQTPFAFPLAFAAGAATCLGPCVAPRFIAAAGLAANRSRRDGALAIASFVAGLVTSYASFGVLAHALERLGALSGWVYGIVAACLAYAGVRELWQDEKLCAHAERVGSRGAGQAYFLGASFALVVSPCCAPMLLGIVTYSAAAGNSGYAGALLACFALGHALPVFCVAAGAGGVGAVLRRYALRQAAGVVSATLMLALAGYYAVLA